jgi:hypothetical protein
VIGREHLVAEDQSSGHAAALGQTSGWPEHDDGQFTAERQERADLVQRFLRLMADAGNPGARKDLGAPVRKLTGQPVDEYWEAEVRDPDTPEGEPGRTVRVYTDGRHGWADSLAYSDRPRAPEDEIPPAQLEAALRAIAADNGVRWSDDSGR